MVNVAQGAEPRGVSPLAHSKEIVIVSVQGLFGGGAAGEEQKKKTEDFINRYQTGKPTEGYTGQEAMEQFQQAAKVATPEQMQKAFQQSVANLPEDQRAEFNQMLQQRQAGKGMIDIERSGERKDVTSRDGGDSVGLDDLLGGLLGGMAGGSAGGSNSGGGLGDILSGMMGGGDTSVQAQPSPSKESKDSGGGLGGMFGDLLDSPIGKAVIAGAAAFAMKEVLGK